MEIPKGFADREDSPRSMRWPKDLAEEVQRIAKETRHDFSTTTFYLLDWAIAEYKRQKSGDASPARRVG